MAGKKSYQITEGDIFMQEKLVSILKCGYQSSMKIVIISELVLQVEQIIVQKEFSGESTRQVRNIAVVKLKSEFEFNMHIQPVCLNSVELNPNSLVSVRYNFDQ